MFLKSALQFWLQSINQFNKAITFILNESYDLISEYEKFYKEQFLDCLDEMKHERKLYGSSCPIEDVLKAF